jgi:L-seryl-tRNA(Ser) seleniumtransferase
MVHDPRRSIPGVDRLLSSEPFQDLLVRHPRERVVRVLRELLEQARAGLSQDGAGQGNTASGSAGAAIPATPMDWAKAAEGELDRLAAPSLRRVLNATGVVLHTNLGRAPLSPEAREAMVTAATGYSNLEFDLETGKRGSRYVHCARLLTELTGAQDALVVNNNAAALVLVLNTLARGRGVVVSRGELVEIGGGFRIPEMLDRSGSRLVEVGATNRTRLADYSRAIEEDPDVGAILKVHRSNFRISGFTEEATLSELVDLGRSRGIPVVFDLGSGLFTSAESLGLPPEPTAAEGISSGGDAVVVSGDKLLGGPQAGIILGRGDLVADMRANPLCRALRVDKVTLAGLEATLKVYAEDPEQVSRRIPALSMMSADVSALEKRCEALLRRLTEAGIVVSMEEGASMIGGGTYPGVELSGPVIHLRPAPGRSPNALAAALRGRPLPVVARVDRDLLVLDLRTVDPAEEDELVAALIAACGS